MSLLRVITKHPYTRAAIAAAGLSWKYGRSWVGQHWLDPSVRAAPQFCMFFGYPRSGHSLVGAMLNAHRNMVIAHEADVLRFVHRGFSQEQILWLLLERDRWFSVNGSYWKGYDYHIPGQWQGRYERPLVVGDKKGGGTSEALSRDPSLLDRLFETVTVPIRFIHVVRNPFDNITTIARRNNYRSLDPAIELYFRFVQTNDKLRHRLDPESLFEIRHESVVTEPATALKRLCAFLGTDAPDDYVEACTGIVFESPQKSRHKLEWSPGEIDAVQARLDQFEFLRGYCYDE